MITFAAQYYDGIVSHATDVTIEVNDDNLVSITGAPELIQFPLEAVSISARLGNTLRKLTMPDGSTCETNAHQELDALLRRGNHGRTGAFLYLLESTWRAALFASVVLVGLLAIGVRWGIPLIAKQAAYAVPTGMAFDLGRGTMSLLDQSILNPSELPSTRQDELSSKFLSLAASYPELPLELHFRRGVGPNAFALPDGSVIVTDELVALAKDDNEILGVLLHEIGHVHHRHALRKALESSTVVLLVSAYLGDVTQLSALSSALPGIIAQQHYSREHETEADTFALEQMDKVRIARRHYANILRALENTIDQKPTRGTNYLASHPPTAERVLRFEQ